MSFVNVFEDVLDRFHCCANFDVDAVISPEEEWVVWDNERSKDCFVSYGDGVSFATSIPWVAIDIQERFCTWRLGKHFFCKLCFPCRVMSGPNYYTVQESCVSWRVGRALDG